MVDLFENKIYDLYYREVGSYPLLSPAEERALLVRYHRCSQCERKIPSRVKATNCPECGTVSPGKLKGREYVCSECVTGYAPIVTSRVCPTCGYGRDVEARQELINANLRFVIRRAKKFTQDPDILSTLISAGNIGLLQAVDRFDINTNVRFLTYAEWWIRKEIMDELHGSHMIHVPTHKQKAIRREYKEGKYKCIHCGVRTDSEYNIKYLPPCDHLQGHDLEIPLHKDALLLSDTLSFDDMVSVTTDNVEINCCTTEMEEVIRTLIENLDLGERDKFIVLGYFDAVTADRKSEPKKLPQLASITGITPERVRQIKEILLKQLKRELQKVAVIDTVSLLPEALS